MKHAARLLILSALPALALCGCSRAPEPPAAPAVTVRLSTENADGNAAAIAAFFQRTCLDASGDQGAFDRALQSSGWEVVRTQRADSSNLINGWQIAHGQLYQSLAEVGQGVRLVDCHVALDASVAPSVERMRAALRPLIRDPSLRPLPHGPHEVSWQWRPNPGEERIVTVGQLEAGPDAGAAAGRRGIAIHFASTPILAQAPPQGKGR